MKSSKCAGHTLMELIVVMGLSGILLTALATSQGFIARTVSVGRAKHAEIAVHLRVASLLDLIVRGADRSTLVTPPRALALSEIVFPTGERLPIASKMLEGSHALLSSEAATFNLWCVAEQRRSLPLLNLEGCPAFPEQVELPADASESAYLALSADGLFSLVGRSGRQSGRRQGCREFALRSEPSLAHPELAAAAPQVELLLPITRELLLLLDNEGNLRWVELRGERVVENQPIMQELSSLGFHVTPDALGLYQLRAEFTLAESGTRARPRSITAAGRVGRVDLLQSFLALRQRCWELYGR